MKGRSQSYGSSRGVAANRIDVGAGPRKSVHRLRSKLNLRKACVLIEKDEHGFYAWCPELKGCQSQGATIEDALANPREAIEFPRKQLNRYRAAQISGLHRPVSWCRLIS